MTSRTVYHYDAICQDANNNPVHHDYWNEEYPTACPFNVPGHVFQTAIVIEQINQTAGIIIEDDSGTNGTYRAKGLNFDVAPGPDTDYKVIGQYSYPYPIRIYSFTILPGSENIGDSFSFVAAPNTIVGVIVADTDGTAVLNVSPTVITNVKIGYEITLNNAGVTAGLGECNAINSGKNQITVQNIPPSSPAGSLVMISLKRLEDITIKSTNPTIFGAHNAGSSFVPAGLTCEIRYKNNTNSAKTFALFAETAY